MSIQAINWVADLGGLRSLDKFVLFGLANYADEFGVTWVRQSRLAKFCGCTDRKVRDAMASLEAAGLILRVLRRRANGSRMSDVSILVGFPRRTIPESREDHDLFRLLDVVEWEIVTTSNRNTVPVADGVSNRKTVPVAPGAKTGSAANQNPLQTLDEIDLPATGNPEIGVDQQPEQFSGLEPSIDTSPPSRAVSVGRVCAREAENLDAGTLALGLPDDDPPPPKKPKRALSIPDGWIPSDRNIADALKEGLTQKDVEREAAKFRDYHLAKGTRFKDWDAGWRTWVRKAREYGGRGGVAGRANTGDGGFGGGIAGAVARRWASRES